MPSTYTRKDGTVVRYETKEYDAQYRAAHSEQPVHCKTCDKQVSALNLARHMRSGYHKKREEELVAPGQLIVAGASPPEPEPVKEPEPEPMPVPLEGFKETIKIYMTVKDLKAKAKELNLKGFSKMTKPQLEELLQKGTIGTPVETVKEVEVEKPAAAAVEVKEPAATKTKGISPWNAFLSEYRKEHNVSLKEAMKQKDAYATWKGKSAA
jgi:hypothetical protein